MRRALAPATRAAVTVVGWLVGRLRWGAPRDASAHRGRVGQRDSEIEDDVELRRRWRE